jgi:hypothetical protein
MASTDETPHFSSDEKKGGLGDFRLSFSSRAVSHAQKTTNMGRTLVAEIIAANELGVRLDPSASMKAGGLFDP